MTLVIVVALLAPAQPLWAYSTGITGYSGKGGFNCNVCHSGGTDPLVSLTGPVQLNPGQTGDFSLTVQSADTILQTGAGLDVAASAGTLSIVSGQGMQKVDAELTHNAPRANDGSGSVAWNFKWKAPATAGNYILYGSGNSVNRNADLNGDRAASTVLSVAVGDVSPLPTPTPTFTVTPSRTKTSTRTPSPRATLTPVSTATTAPSDIPTSVVTPTPSAEPTATLTATFPLPPTDTPSATTSPTETASATSVATSTSAATATPSPTASSRPTTTATATATPLPSATPTAPATPGDANCDVSITASDLVATMTGLSSTSEPSCGADINGDGVITVTDLDTLIALLFEVDRQQ